VRARLIAEMPEITEVLVHTDVENDELARTTYNLPFRNEIRARLQQRWQSLGAADAIEQITLHYLSGELIIDIYLPLNIVQNIKEAQLLSQRFAELVGDEPEIDTINIYYRSTQSEQIFKIGELRKIFM